MEVQEGAAAPSIVDSIELWASKLQWDWPAPSQVGQLTKERLAALVPVFETRKLDNMVKVRILLSCLFLPRAELEALQPELLALRAAACKDEDEWVLVTGAAVGNYSGQLDTSALLSGPNKSDLVTSTLQGLWDALDHAQPPDNFRPLQEVFMHPEVLSPGAPTTQVATPAKHSHFVVRQDQGSKFSLAPPPVSCLVDGSATLGATSVAADGHKGDHARRAAAHPSAAASTSSLFRSSSNSISGAGVGSTGLMKHSHAHSSHGPSGGSLHAGGGVPGHGSGGHARKGVYSMPSRLSTQLQSQPSQEPTASLGQAGTSDLEAPSTEVQGRPEQPAPETAQEATPAMMEFTYTVGELSSLPTGGTKRARSTEENDGGGGQPDDIEAEQI